MNATLWKQLRRFLDTLYSVGSYLCFHRFDCDFKQISSSDPNVEKLLLFYRQYATLYVALYVDQAENELAILDLIQVTVWSKENLGNHTFTIVDLRGSSGSLFWFDLRAGHHIQRTQNTLHFKWNHPRRNGCRNRLGFHCGQLQKSTTLGTAIGSSIFIFIQNWLFSLQEDNFEIKASHTLANLRNKINVEKRLSDINNNLKEFRL